MKIYCYLTALVLVCLLVFGFPITAQAADAPLTLNRAVQISDTEIVLEFSEPIAINKHNTNNGPYVAVRYLTPMGTVGYAMNEYGVNGVELQWKGELFYIGSDRTKLLWRQSNARLGCETINKIRDCDHPDAVRSIKKNSLEMYFIIEEIPFDEKTVAADGKIDNITTEDGSEYLFPNLPRSWEGYRVAIDVDYSYSIDRSNIRGINSTTQDWDFPILFDGEGLADSEPVNPPVQTTTIIRNNPITIALIFGADVLVLAAVVVAILVVKKKRKAA